MTYKSAYTLIEILIGLTLVTIVFTIGLAGYRDFSRRQVLSGASKKVISDLRLAQQKASIGQKPDLCTTLNGYGVDFNLNSSTYTVFADCSNNDITETTTTLDGVASSTDFTIIFKTLGHGTNLAATQLINLYYLGDISKTVSITVGLGGGIK